MAGVETAPAVWEQTCLGDNFWRYSFGNDDDGCDGDDGGGDGDGDIDGNNDDNDNGDGCESKIPGDGDLHVGANLLWDWLANLIQIFPKYSWMEI